MKPTRTVLPFAALAAALAQQCGDIYCASDETCCKDFPGAQEQTECCITMVTECVAPRGPFTTSTCCPKWTVGCTLGSVGCCDPARPWQLESAMPRADQATERLPNLHSAAMRQISRDPPSSKALSNLTGYALFPLDTLFPGMHAFAFDASTGVVTSKVAISGPFAKYYDGYYGGSTRLFAFDASTAKFYIADQYDGASGRQSAPTPTVLFTIDPVSGNSSVVSVLGCGGYPVGQAFDAESRVLVLGTQTATTASLCAVDPATGKGTPIGSIDRGGSESASDSFYAAYLSHVSAGAAHRLGHRLVTQGGELGLTTTQIDAVSGALNASFSPVSFGGHGIPTSMHAHPAGGFVSLAPVDATGGAATPYDIVGWGASAGDVRVLASLPDAFPPSIPISNAPLGYVGAALAGGKYAAVTVKHGHSAISDQWRVNLLDLASGALSSAALDPQPSKLGAETASLSGFGLVAA